MTDWVEGEGRARAGTFDDGHGQLVVLGILDEPDARLEEVLLDHLHHACPRAPGGGMTGLGYGNQGHPPPFPNGPNVLGLVGKGGRTDFS